VNSRGRLPVEEAERFQPTERQYTVPNTNLLGKRVIYTSTDGYQKAAKIIGTAESIQEGTGVPVPGEGEAHLLVFSPTGKTYTRTNVTEGEGPGTFARV
jgi:hypothetical protein